MECVKRFIALPGCAVFALIMAGQAMAQAKQPGTDLNRLSGRVHIVKKDANEFQIRAGNACRTIVYDDSTAFSFRKRKSDINSLKERVRVISLGNSTTKTV